MKKIINLFAIFIFISLGVTAFAGNSMTVTFGNGLLSEYLLSEYSNIEMTNNYYIDISATQGEYGPSLSDTDKKLIYNEAGNFTFDANNCNGGDDSSDPAVTFVLTDHYIDTISQADKFFPIATVSCWCNSDKDLKCGITDKGPAYGFTIASSGNSHISYNIVPNS